MTCVFRTHLNRSPVCFCVQDVPADLLVQLVQQRLKEKDCLQQVSSDRNLSSLLSSRGSKVKHVPDAAAHLNSRCVWL